MKQILAFSGSMSTNSINHKLVEFTADQVLGAEVKIIRLSDFEAPLYRSEMESELGFPETVVSLRKLFDEADAFIISTPEYNSSIPAGFKNTIDWLSRMEVKVFQNKPVLLMATSPGARGGRSVLDHLSAIMPFWGAQMVGTFSLPKFKEHFTEGILAEPFQQELQELLAGLPK